MLDTTKKPVQKSMRNLGRIIVALSAVILVDALLTIYAALYAPFPLRVPLGSPTAYLNIYIHVPMAWSSYLLFTGALVSAILFIWRGHEKYDKLVYGFALTGIIYAIVTTASGSMWASESWGSPWNWDPRETGIVMLLLAYIVYFAIRSSIPDPDRASKLSAVYAIAAYATVPLSFLAPSLVGGLHPTPRATSPFFSQPGVLPVFLSKIILASIVGVAFSYLVSKLRSREAGVAELERKILLASGAIVIILGVVASALLLSPYSSNPARVVNAVIDENGLIKSVYLSTGENIVFKKPITSPINPPLIREGNKTLPTLLGHIVVVKDNKSLEVVIHWSVAGNLLLYSLMIGLLSISIASRLKRRQ